MTTEQIIQNKAALTALLRVGRLNEDALRAQVAVAQNRPLPTVDCKEMIARLEGKGWISGFTDPVLEQVLYVVTPDGRVALTAMP